MCASLHFVMHVVIRGTMFIYVHATGSHSHRSDIAQRYTVHPLIGIGPSVGIGYSVAGAKGSSMR